MPIIYGGHRAWGYGKDKTCSVPNVDNKFSDLQVFILIIYYVYFVARFFSVLALAFAERWSCLQYKCGLVLPSSDHVSNAVSALQCPMA